ncbi:lipase chaperone [Gynuella sunshinyii YC6258]|uniref:Lipase chaperone n=2 Tax=Gynuella sunshinyii TaxID=1445505 RepID=A0A0C5VKQ3_9GAMM|nr:lipase chaperone [Gynuella sunshinyii YC6258]
MYGIFSNDKKTRNIEITQKVKMPEPTKVQPQAEQHHFVTDDSASQNPLNPAENVLPESQQKRVASLLQKLSTDKQGSLVINGYLLRSLDQLYELIPHNEDAAGCSTWITSASAVMEESTRTQVSEMLDAYCEYRTSLLISALKSHETEEISSAIESNEAVSELRRRYFSPEVVNQLFAEEEVQSQYMLAAMNTLNDQSLNEDEQQNRLKELQNRFNSEISKLDSPLADIQRAYEVEKLREQGASESDIFSYRSEAMGSDSAAQKADEDLKIQELSSRYYYFLEQREQIKHSGLDSNDANAQISTLLETLFTAEELRLLHTRYFKQLEP